jgi:hypothetical protein
MQPDFLIIGAQKCATSWLHYHLRQHSDIFFPEDKDNEFFSYTGNLNKLAFDHWLRRFDGAAAVTRTGDANAAYFWTNSGSQWGDKPGSFNPAIPESIRQFLGDQVQLIVSLRDPVERAVSAYLHHIAYGAVHPDDTIEHIAAPLGILDMGFYGAHLDNWLKTYPAKQFLLLNGLPVGQLAGLRWLDVICAFIGVPPFPASHPVEIPIFPGVPRKELPDGIWVSVEHPSIARYLPLKRAAPLKCIGDTNYIRLIGRAELDRLRNIYRQDQQKLASLLTDSEICTPASGGLLETGAKA